MFTREITANASARKLIFSISCIGVCIVIVHMCFLELGLTLAFAFVLHVCVWTSLDMYYVLFQEIAAANNEENNKENNKENDKPTIVSPDILNKICWGLWRSRSSHNSCCRFPKPKGIQFIFIWFFCKEEGKYSSYFCDVKIESCILFIKFFCFGFRFQIIRNLVFVKPCWWLVLGTTPAQYLRDYLSLLLCHILQYLKDYASLFIQQLNHSIVGTFKWH